MRGPEGFALLLLTLAVLGACGPTTPPPTPTPFLHPGDEGTLYVEGLETFFIAVDEAAYDELLDAIAIDDVLGAEQMLLRGNIFPVDNNTRVLLLARGPVFTFSPRMRIRVLEGPATGRAGWVHVSWVKP